MTMTTDPKDTVIANVLDGLVAKEREQFSAKVKEDTNDTWYWWTIERLPEVLGEWAVRCDTVSRGRAFGRGASHAMIVCSRLFAEFNALYEAEITAEDAEYEESKQTHPKRYQGENFGYSIRGFANSDIVGLFTDEEWKVIDGGLQRIMKRFLKHEGPIDVKGKPLSTETETLVRRLGEEAR